MLNPTYGLHRPLWQYQPGRREHDPAPPIVLDMPLVTGGVFAGGSMVNPGEVGVDVVRSSRVYDGDLSTKLLLHADGVDAAAVTYDASAFRRAVTFNGDAQLDTAQTKFGASSLLFDGTGDYLSIPASTDFDFGTGDFTLDFWLRRNGAQTTDCNVINGDPATAFGGWRIGFNGATSMAFWGGPAVEFAFGFASPVDLTWAHIAVVRRGTTITGYLNGVNGGSQTNAAACNSGGGAIHIARNSAAYYAGWLDEVRVSKGVARWLTDFTPPVRAYGYEAR